MLVLESCLILTRVPSPDVSPDSVARAFQGARSVEFATEKRVGVLVQYVERGEGVNSAEGVPWSGRSRNLVKYLG